MKNRYLLFAVFGMIALFSASCSMFGLDLQKDYKYEASTLDAHIGKSAKQYLLDRGKTPVVANDTVFKWMQLGLEYAGIDLAEFEKPGRTFLFLNNNAIRVRNATSGAITAGMWFDLPIMEKNPDGSQKFMADGVTPVTHPATKWSEYSPATVKNYFLSLIAQGELGFDNVKVTNTSLPTLLAPGAVAGKESKLGYLVVSSAPNLNAAGARSLVYDYTGGTGKGFDPEGMINYKILNSDYSPLQVNDFTTLATSGIIATNGQVHVAAGTVYPARY